MSVLESTGSSIKIQNNCLFSTYLDKKKIYTYEIIKCFTDSRGTLNTLNRIV